jgi:toxin FitB
LIVLDTNVLSGLMRADETTGIWARQLTDRDLRTTAVNVAEIRYGIERLPVGRKRDQLAAHADAVITQFRGRILAFDLRSALHMGALLAHREGIGRPLSFPDAQIAAMAATHGGVVATRNVRDFEDCGLTIVNPWA